MAAVAPEQQGDGAWHRCGSATCRRADPAGLQILLLLAVLDQAGPVGIDPEMGYGGKIQLVILVTK